MDCKFSVNDHLTKLNEKLVKLVKNPPTVVLSTDQHVDKSRLFDIDNILDKSMSEWTNKVKTCIKNGANVDSRCSTSGQTPLMIVCSLSNAYCSYFDAIVDFLSKYSDITLADNNGMTALHHSCYSGQYYASKLLLSLLIRRQKTYCLEMKDKKHGKDAAEIAYERGFIRIGKLFENINQHDQKVVIRNDRSDHGHNEVKNVHLGERLSLSTSPSYECGEESAWCPETVTDCNGGVVVCAEPGFEGMYKQDKEKEKKQNEEQDDMDEYQYDADYWNEDQRDNCDKCSLLTESLDANVASINDLRHKNKKLHNKNIKLEKENNMLKLHEYGLNKMLEKQNDLIFALQSQINKFRQLQLQSQSK